MENSFFIPINSGSLAHYFSRAIILPAKYFSNKPEDIQNAYGDFILLSLNKWVKNSDCTLEVVLTDTEIQNLIPISQKFFYCKTPIPISRVKSICFLEAKQKETTMWNINNGAAFIPESIVSVQKSNNIEPISDSELKKVEDLNLASEISDKTKRFDIILGGLAFMRLGGKSFMNYSPNYFATLSYFNNLIEDQTNSAAREKGLKFDNKYIGLFSKNESEWSRWQQYIYQNLETQDIEILAQKEEERLEKKFGLIKIDSINPKTHLYELAILATYGDRKHKSTDDLVTDLTNGTIIPDKVEDVSILFGLNNGYSKLRNKYKGSGRDYIVKFNLESKLDYYIIESVFQFAFNGSKTNYSFDYIDKWCPLNKKAETYRGYETYKILDATVIAKKKQTPLEIFLESYSTDIYSAIIKSINLWLPPFAKSDEKLAIQYFEKQLRGALTLSVEALQKKIEKDFEENYNSQKQEAIASYKIEIDKLLSEISFLKEENQRLKSQNNLELVTEQTATEEKKDAGLEVNYPEGNSEEISVVQEPQVSSISDSYSSLSITDLKKIAKERGIPDAILKGFKKENKKELIALIMKTPEQPKIL